MSLRGLASIGNMCDTLYNYHFLASTRYFVSHTTLLSAQLSLCLRHNLVDDIVDCLRTLLDEEEETLDPASAVAQSIISQSIEFIDVMFDDKGGSIRALPSSVSRHQFASQLFRQLSRLDMQYLPRYVLHAAASGNSSYIFRVHEELTKMNEMYLSRYFAALVLASSSDQASLNGITSLVPRENAEFLALWNSEILNQRYLPIPDVRVIDVRCSPRLHFYFRSYVSGLSIFRLESMVRNRCDASKVWVSLFSTLQAWDESLFGSEEWWLFLVGFFSFPCQPARSKYRQLCTRMA